MTRHSTSQGIRRWSRAGALVALVGAVALGTAACASGGAGQAPVDSYAGMPNGVTDLPDETLLEPFASWQQGGERIALTLFGSSGCPPVGTSLTVRSSNSLVVELEAIPPETVCTADYVPHTTEFTTPADVTTSSDVSIAVDDQVITLPALR